MPLVTAAQVTNPAYDSVRIINNNRIPESTRSASPQMSKMAIFGDSRQSSTSSESSRYSNPVPSKVMNPVYELQSKRQRRTSSDEGSITSVGSGKVVNTIYEQVLPVNKPNPVYAELQPRTATDSCDLSTSPSSGGMPLTSVPQVGLTSSLTKEKRSSIGMPRPRSAGSDNNYKPPITAPKPKLAAKPGAGSSSVWVRPEKRYSTSSAVSTESARSENRMSVESIKSEYRMSTGSSLSENRMSSGSDSSQNFQLGSSVSPGSGVSNQALSAIPVMEGNAKVMNLAQFKVNGQSRSSDSLESTDSSGSAHNKLAAADPAPIPTPRQKVGYRNSLKKSN